MEKFTRQVSRVLGVILTILMAAIVLDVTWQVVTRFILKKPSSFTEELAGFLLIWIGILGASYALYTRSHLGIDIFTSKIRGAGKRIVEVAVYAVVFLFALFVLCIGGIRLVRLTFTLDQVSASMGIPMGYVYLVLPLSGILMMLFSTGFIVQASKQGFREEAKHPVSALD
jgi:TRAP-type C4-dicarboxylate transport system permease small subunit